MDFNFWICVLRSGFVFLLFLFKTHLDLNSCDFWFSYVFNFFYLVKINKFLFIYLDADAAFFNAKIKFFIIILIVSSTTLDFTVKALMESTKMKGVFF